MITLVVVPIVVAIASGITASMIVVDNTRKSVFVQSVYDSFSLDTMLEYQLKFKDEDYVNYVSDGTKTKKDTEMKIYNLLINADATLSEAKYGDQKLGFKEYDEGYACTCYTMSISIKFTLLQLEYRDSIVGWAGARGTYYKYYKVNAELGKNIRNTIMAI